MHKAIWGTSVALSVVLLASCAPQSEASPKPASSASISSASPLLSSSPTPHETENAQQSPKTGSFVQGSEPDACSDIMPQEVLNVVAGFRGTAEPGFIKYSEHLELRGGENTIRVDCGYEFTTHDSGVIIRLTEGGSDADSDWAYSALEKYASSQGETTLDGGLRATWSEGDNLLSQFWSDRFSATLMSFWIPEVFDRTGNTMTVSMGSFDVPGGSPLSVDEMTSLANVILSDVPGVYEAFYQKYLEKEGYADE